MKHTVVVLLAAGALMASSLGQTAAEALAAPLSTADEAKARREEDLRQREAKIHAKWNVCVDLQMVEMEEGKALELIPEFQSEDDSKAEAAWVRLQAMIKSKDASLIAWPMVRMIDGDRAVSESIVEKRYPTEFEPPQEPSAGGIPPLAPRVPTDKPPVESGIPTAFETRNLGVTLEVEATVLDEGKRVYLNLVPQRVELLEMEKNESVLTKRNLIVQIHQPLFATTKSTLSLSVPSGSHRLVGVHELTKPEKHIEFHIVRATVMKAD